MKIEDLVENMNEYLKSGSVSAGLSPCSDLDIVTADTAFAAEFGQPFPAAYKRVLRVTNGVLHNGLVIWPATPGALFRETIFQANKELREDFSDDFIYFGRMDEELYVFDRRHREYCAIEFVGKPVWKHFSSADEMFEFMLERAWGG